MLRKSFASAACLALTLVSSAASLAHGDRHERGDPAIQVGARPMFLIQGMGESELKQRLLKCEDDLVRRTKFSIAHRGAPLQFPEHTRESYDAGARMGAGIVECDVTFTKDGQLV